MSPADPQTAGEKTDRTAAQVEVDHSGGPQTPGEKTDDTPDPIKAHHNDASVDAELIKRLANDPESMANAYGAVGTLKAVLENPYVVVCSLFASLSGFLFGCDQGLVSVTLVMPRFLQQFPETDEAVSSNSGLYKGVLTALLELGAVFGALMAGFVADSYGRKNSIRFGVVWFTLGAILQTTSFGYAQLVIGRFIGGIGIGILSLSAPIYIAEVSPPSIRGVVLATEEFFIVFGICVAFYV